MDAHHPLASRPRTPPSGKAALVFAAIWSGYFLVNINITLIIPLLPFIKLDVGLSSREVAAVLAAFPVVALLSNIAVGPFIDRYGRKRFIVVGALGCAATFLFTASARNGLVVVIGRAATGLFMPMIGASTFAAVADYFPATGRTRVTGYVMSASPLAFLVAIPLGVLLGGFMNWQTSFIALSAFSLALALSAAMLPLTRREALSPAAITLVTYRDRLLSFSQSGNNRALLLSYFCISAAALVFLGLFPAWAVAGGFSGIGLGTVSALLFLGGVGGLLGALLSGWLARFFRHPLQLCAVISFATGVSVLAASLLPIGLALQTAGYWGFSFGRALILSLIISSAMAMAHPAERGSLNAMLNAIFQTASAIGGAASAWLYTARPDFIANSVVSAALFAIASLLLWSFVDRKKVVGG